MTRRPRVILKVHTSNYRITGFTESTSVADLAAAAAVRARPLVVDLGSGLLDANCPWLPGAPPDWLRGEPAVRQTLAAGADLVTFSGDKLLGGPQAGILAGRADLIERCRSHPLARALRPGGLVLEVLQDVALAYLRRDAGRTLPLWQMAMASVDELRPARGPRGGDDRGVPGDHGWGHLAGGAHPLGGHRLRGRHDRAFAGRVAAGDRPGHRRADRLRPPHGAPRPGPVAGQGARGMRVIATAGHVDHGKSTLVHALTGTDPDRWAEEKARGLTIDLGFASMTLPSGEDVGLVDVPGHGRFIKNMLAGVGAVDGCLFVVDAGEGWKAQSEEHLRILELLGVKRGLVALTKVGRLDTTDRELACDQVRDRLDGTFLSGGELIQVDAAGGPRPRRVAGRPRPPAGFHAGGHRRGPPPPLGGPLVRHPRGRTGGDRHAARRFARPRRRARRRAWTPAGARARPAKPLPAAGTGRAGAAVGRQHHGRVAPPGQPRPGPGPAGAMAPDQAGGRLPVRARRGRASGLLQGRLRHLPRQR